MHLSVIRTNQDLEAFVPEWHAYVQAHPDATPFHLPAWLLTWWKHLGSGSLRVLVIREDGRLCSVVPCFLLLWQGRWQLTLFGSGVTDYLDPLITPGDEERVTAVIEQYLNDDPEWEIVDWTDIDPRHPIFAMSHEPLDWIPRSELPFEGTFEEYWKGRGYDLRRNVRRYREKALKAGPVDFQLVDRGAPDFIDNLIDLHTRRWNAQGQPGMVEANRSAGFLSGVASEMSNLGYAKFFTLRFRGDLAAVIFAMEYRNRVYGYMSAFDPDLSAFSFGRILLYESIRHCFERCCAWDFLRGEEPYKNEWGARNHPRARLRLERLRAASA